jgi:hypothetical protein
VRLKNFGATIKGKIYFGDNIKPQNTNPLWDPPSEGNSQDYNIASLNDNGTIGYETFEPQLTFRRETTNDVIETFDFKQYVYWTFGTPQIDINVARINVAVWYVFSGQTKTDTKQILQDMLNKEKLVQFGVKCIRDNVVGEAINWNKLNEQEKQGVDGVDCISHSEFFQKIINAAGLPIKTGVKTYIANFAMNNKPNRPETATEGSFDWDFVNFNGNLLFDPTHPQGGGINSPEASKFGAINNKLIALGQYHHANLIFYSGTKPNNFEAAITLFDTKSGNIYFNPGGFKVLYTVNEQDKIITKHMTTLEWQFWKKITTTDSNGVNITIERKVLTNERIIDYSY